MEEILGSGKGITGQAYLVHVNSHNRKHLLDIVKKIYSQKGLIIEEYELEGERYLVCYTHPGKVLPYDLFRKIRTDRIRASEISKLSRREFNTKTERKIEKGTRVEIVNGPYRGMKGVFDRELHNGKVRVYVSVFGQPVPVEVEIHDIIALEHR